MDITFNCPECEQELVVDSSYAGEEIECPECSAKIIVPGEDQEEQATDENEEAGQSDKGDESSEGEKKPAAVPGAGTVINAMASSAAAREHKTFSVPVHDAATAPDPLIQKPQAPLNIAAKKWQKGVAVKTIRRVDCMEVGKDHFDEKVTEFINTIGNDRILQIQTLSYTTQDLATKALMTDFGVLIMYRIAEE